MVVRNCCFSNLKKGLFYCFFTMLAFSGYAKNQNDTELLFLIFTGILAYQMSVHFVAAMDRNKKIEIETNGLYISCLKDSFLVWEEISDFSIRQSSKGYVNGII